MTSRDIASPQDPREFLAEMQRNSMRENQQESFLPLDQPQLTTSPQEPQSPQDPNVAITAIAMFSHQAQMLVFDMMSNLREVEYKNKALSAENKQMHLTIAKRDADIEELTARIETLTR